MADDDEVLVICGRTSAAMRELAGRSEVGSCGCDVWLSPSGQKVFDDPTLNVRLICMVHVDPAEMLKMVTGQVLSVPGAEEDVRKALGDEGVARTRAFGIKEWER